MKLSGVTTFYWEQSLPSKHREKNLWYKWSKNVYIYSYDQYWRLQQSSCRKILKKNKLWVMRNPPEFSRIHIPITLALRDQESLRHSQDSEVNTYLNSTLWKTNLLNSWTKVRGIKLSVNGNRFKLGLLRCLNFHLKSLKKLPLKY